MSNPRDRAVDAESSQRSGLLDELRPPDQTAGTGVGDFAEPLDAEAGTTAAEGHESRTRFAGRFSLEGRTLKQHTARGVIINSSFQVGLISLNLLQRLIVAAYLTLSEFGFWGLLVTTLATLAWLKEVGISDKYIQQDESDQVAAFQKAFTFELLYSMLFYLVCAAALPVYAQIFDRPEIIVPGLVLCLQLPLGALMSPVWIFYRRMQFVRQRTILAVGPILSTVVTVGLAVAGAGYWSLIIGSVLGTAIGAAVAVALAPYPLALRFERGTLGEYFRFSWPLFLNSLAGLIAVQGAVIIGNYTVGLVGIAAIGLAGNFAQFVNKVDGVIKQTMYPAVCAVKERRQALQEAFVKSNRLGMMWGLPFGISLALFGPDLVTFALGEKWRIAEPLLQVFGLILGANQVAFNWTLFMRALDWTWPIALEGLVALLLFGAVTVPLMLTLGLSGYAIGAAAIALGQLVLRGWYLSRLFAGFNLLRHLGRALAPSVPAVAAVLAVRALEGGERTLGLALAEIALYATVTAIATWAFERDLLREVRGYLRRVHPSTASPSPAPAP